MLSHRCFKSDTSTNAAFEKLSASRICHLHGQAEKYITLRPESLTRIIVKLLATQVQRLPRRHQAPCHGEMNH
jgi:hypothetical protein